MSRRPPPGRPGRTADPRPPSTRSTEAPVPAIPIHPHRATGHRDKSDGPRSMCPPAPVCCGEREQARESASGVGRVIDSGGADWAGNSPPNKMRSLRPRRPQLPLVAFPLPPQQDEMGWVLGGIDLGGCMRRRVAADAPVPAGPFSSQSATAPALRVCYSWNKHDRARPLVKRSCGRTAPNPSAQKRATMNRLPPLGRDGGRRQVGDCVAPYD